MRAKLLALLLAATGVGLGLTGCSEALGSKTVIELKDVPPDIMAVAKKNLPDVTFDTAWKKANGNYEVRGKTKNGKVREIDIRPDGSVEEIE